MQSKRQNKRPLLRPPEGGFEAVNRGFESRVYSLILQLISGHL